METLTTRGPGRPRLGEEPSPTKSVKAGFAAWVEDANERKRKLAELRGPEHRGPISFHRKVWSGDMGLLDCGHIKKPPIRTPYAYCEVCRCQRLRNVLEF